MRRLFWAGVGAVGAVVVARRARRMANRLPDAVADQVEEAGRRASTALRAAVDEFRAARTARETELVEALLVEPAGGTERRPRTRRRSPEPAWEADPWSDDEDDGF
jgi:hypothetical protein